MARRKTVDIEPIIRPEYPDVDPFLRDEVDPDPLVEEMVIRLRAGLSSMVAIDEWGRPVAWRNVVRLALGPLASKLRDTEQALNLAVSLIPASEPLSSVDAEQVPEALELVPEAAPSPIAEPVVDEADPLGLELPAEPVAEAEPTIESNESLPTVEAIAELLTESLAEPTAEAIAEEPAAEAIAEVEPELAPTPVVQQVAAAPQWGPSGVDATSLFVVSGDQRAVPMRSFSSRELLGGRGTDDATRAENNRFLTSLYSQGQQVGRDQD